GVFASGWFLPHQGEGGRLAPSGPSQGRGRVDNRAATRPPDAPPQCSVLLSNPVHASPARRAFAAAKQVQREGRRQTAYRSEGGAPPSALLWRVEWPGG